MIIMFDYYILLLQLCECFNFYTIRLNDKENILNKNRKFLLFWNN